MQRSRLRLAGEVITARERELGRRLGKRRASSGERIFRRGLPQMKVRMRLEVRWRLSWCMAFSGNRSSVNGLGRRWILGRSWRLTVGSAGGGTANQTRRLVWSRGRGSDAISERDWKVSSPAWQPVQRPVKAGVLLTAQAEDRTPAEAGSYTGRQATGAVSGRSWNSFCGASRRWKPGGGGKSRRSPSGRCSVRAKLEIHQQRKPKMENWWSGEVTSAASSRCSDQLRAETSWRPRSKMSPRKRLRVTSAASLEDEKFRMPLKIHRQA